MFEQSLVLPTPDNKRWTFAVSLSMQAFAISILLLIPLIYTERLSQALVRGPMFAPTPPPPPPPVQIAAAPQQVTAVSPRVAMPFQLAPRIAHPKPDVDLHARVFADAPVLVCPSCVVGGTGQFASADFSGLGGRVAPAPAPPPPPANTQQRTKVEPAKPLRVGGDVLAAKLVKRVMPVYPPLARNARIFGVVRLQGTISKDGTIKELQVLSGHPLLVKAALEAVSQWVYRPTLLNGEPVEVNAPIDVNFTLSN